jgi:hypothetical protein
VWICTQSNITSILYIYIIYRLPIGAFLDHLPSKTLLNLAAYFEIMFSKSNLVILAAREEAILKINQFQPIRLREKQWLSTSQFLLICNVLCLLFIVYFILFMKRLLNDSNKGWKMVEEETNLYMLTTLMVSWIDCLMVIFNYAFILT